MTLCQALDDFKVICPPNSLAFSAMYMFYMAGALVVFMVNHKNSTLKLPTTLNTTATAKTFLNMKDEYRCLPIVDDLHEYLLNFNASEFALNQQEDVVTFGNCSDLEDVPSLLQFLAKLEIIHNVEEAVVEVAEDAHKSFGYICWTIALNAFITLSEEFGRQVEMAQTACINESTNRALCCYVDLESDYFEAHLREFRRTAEYLAAFIRVTTISYVVNLPVYTVVIGGGLLLNSCLLLIFIKEKNVRSGPNLMILNLTLTDVLNLSVFGMATLFLFASTVSTEAFNANACRTTLILRDIIFRLTQLSIVAMAGQRYLATLVLMNQWNMHLDLSPLQKAILYVLVIWIVSAGLATVAVVLGTWEHNSCFIMLGGGLKPYEFTVHCGLLPIAVIIFCVLTARRLKHSVRKIPGERFKVTQRELGRYRSAQVLYALSLAYFLTYVPYTIADFLMSVLGFDVRHMQLVFWFMTVMNGLVIANPLCNTLALYFSSSVFRNLFNTYLFNRFRCKTKINEMANIIHQRVTSTESSEMSQLSGNTIWYLKN